MNLNKCAGSVNHRHEAAACYFNVGSGAYWSEWPIRGCAAQTARPAVLVQQTQVPSLHHAFHSLWREYSLACFLHFCNPHYCIGTARDSQFKFLYLGYNLNMINKLLTRLLRCFVISTVCAWTSRLHLACGKSLVTGSKDSYGFSYISSIVDCFHICQEHGLMQHEWLVVCLWLQWQFGFKTCLLQESKAAIYFSLFTGYILSHIL